MILPDVNILLNAFRRDATHHEICREWLLGVVNGPAAYGISQQVLSSVIRLATHPRVFANPDPLENVVRFCTTVLDQPHCRMIAPGPRHWSIFIDLCRNAEVKGNLVQGAWLAALAIESGCVWITLDRDYARFAGLHWRTPD